MAIKRHIKDFKEFQKDARTLESYPKGEKSGPDKIAIKNDNLKEGEDNTAEVNGFKLIHSIWKDDMTRDPKISGTIRTSPENYWVCSVDKQGKLVFDSWEQQTKHVDKDKVQELWDAGKIPTEN